MSRPPIRDVDLLPVSEAEVLARVNEIVDPESRRKFGELNIVTGVRVAEDGTVEVRFSPSSPYSPIAVNLGLEIKRAARQVTGVSRVVVECEGHMMDDLVNRLVNEAE